ncbi:MAG TPA: hypothetical protein VD789_00340 [Thermomicrobiales bacterium]|nr:hypothetical protein [Thermomicrobiales bacterium]
MDPHRFDSLSRCFALKPLNLRVALASGAAGTIAAGVGTVASSTVGAQEVTPVLSRDDTTGPEMLFVQSYESGSVAPKAGEDGRYTVTLEHGLGPTIYFSDRPDRPVGASPTRRFLDGLGFTRDTPPNAATLADNGSGETAIAVVELFDSIYDAASTTVTYEMVMLEHWQDSTELDFAETPVDLGTAGATFGTVHLSIDGCPTGEITCVSTIERRVIGRFGLSMFDGYCYSSMAGTCPPCPAWHDTNSPSEAYWAEACNEIFPGCGGTCFPTGVCILDASSQ